MEQFNISALNEEAGRSASAHINTLTKPIGSLGKLEQIAIELAKMTGQTKPSLKQLGIIVFAADHGIVEEGVSAFPQEVTQQMVANMVHGGAAINVFGRQQGAKFKYVDVGMIGETGSEQVVHRKIRQGTNNFLREPAMTMEEAMQAVQTGYEEAKSFFEAGVDCLIVGEVGIGNTTTSSAVVAAATGIDPAELVGYGTGISAEQHEEKINVVRQAIVLHDPAKDDGIEILAKVGGFEIAAMAGAMIAAASKQIPVILDGFISTAAACVANLIAPGAADYMLLGHQSAEPGHQKAFEFLQKEPIIQLDMRLGEGTGAAVAYSIIQSALRMAGEMATFESAGVSGKE